MKFYLTGQEKSDCLIEVTTWAGLTVYIFQLVKPALVTTSIKQSNSFNLITTSNKKLYLL